MLGTWIVTFTSGGTCIPSQIAIIVSQEQTGAHTGTYGSHAISCTGFPDDPEDGGTVTDWQVNGNDFTLQVSNVPPRRFIGEVSGGSWSGTYTWGTITGAFSAAKQ